MSLRSEAQTFAENAVRAGLHELFGENGFIERRIEWRWANAARLAREAEYMVDHLPHWRVLARARWLARARRFAAKAFAQQPAIAKACGVCPRFL